MALRHLKRCFVQFSPGDPKAVSTRELLQRLTGDKARKSNPACDLAFNIAEDAAPGKAFVELVFNDNSQLKINTGDFSVEELINMIDRKGREIELRTVLNEVKGFDPWKQGNRLSR